MTAKSKAELQRRYDERRARLPEWLRDVDDYVDHRILNEEEDGRDGEMWREHGGDMLKKIEQLLNALAEKDREIAELKTAVSTAKFDGGVEWQTELNAAKQRAEAAEAERDQLRQQLNERK